MGSIEDVIQRSREPGQFSERKQFTVARSRAIQKLRQFALASPSFYILEWIQAAIANGATYLDLAIEASEVRMSYVGGGFTRAELEALFDFLFASKDDLEIADVRQLALGVNALMQLNPTDIVIESGDGTVEGTTRVELNPKTDAVVVGRPMAALEGTFVRASWGGFATSRGERAVIEERCLTAPIPILVNDESLFGYSTMRSPELFGYRSTLKFDEGDLYGTLGLATTPITENFKLLTWGTWISTTRHTFADLPAIGGVVGYDRLRKTADHASIVQDAVYEEMWARLVPYARRLAAGNAGAAVFDIRLLGGPAVTAQEFRLLAHENNRAVVLSRGQLSGAVDQERAARFGAALAAPVFVVPARDVDVVRSMAGPEVDVHTPTLTEAELRFLEMPLAVDPPRPWLTGAIEVAEISPADIAEHFGGSGSRIDELQRLMRNARSTALRIFTPASDAVGQTTVELRSEGRMVWRGPVATPFPCHHIVAEMTGFPRHRLTDDGTRDGVIVAQAIARAVLTQLAAASDRVVLATRPGQAICAAARQIVLASISRSAMLRLRGPDSGNVVRFSLQAEEIADYVLDLGLLETWSGALISLRDLEALLPRTRGLVYAARDERDLPDGLERDLVLKVDDTSEHTLIDLVGEEAYVCLSAGVVADWLRDLSNTAPPLEARRRRSLPAPGRTDETAFAREVLLTWRREQSIDLRRYLIWFLANGADAPLRAEVGHEPLFRTGRGAALTFAQIQDRLRSGELRMADGWLTSASVSEDDDPDNAVLAMDPFAFFTLAKLGRILPLLDVDFSTAEAVRNPATPPTAFLLEERLEDTGLEGVIGIPAVRVDHAIVLWFDRAAGRTIALRDLGEEFGVVGRVFTDSVKEEEVRARCADASRRLLTRLVADISGMAADAARCDRGVDALLRYASQHIEYDMMPDGSLQLTVFDALADRALALPMVAARSGVSVSPMTFLKEFESFRHHEPHTGRTMLAQSASPTISEWLLAVTDSARFGRIAPVAIEERPRTELVDWLNQAMAALRTDEDGPLTLHCLSQREFEQAQPERFGRHSELVIERDDRVYINVDYPLFQALQAADAAGRRELGAWLLLAVYAHINEIRYSVTNLHELHFQARLLDWLEAST